MLNKFLSFLKDRNGQLKSVNEWILFLFLLVGGFVGFNTYVDFLVNQRVNKPETIDLISSKISPVIIFDSEKRIISGQNALGKYLSDIKIIKDGKNIKKMVISAKCFLSTAPILESLDEGDFVIQESRGEGFKWIYEFLGKNTLTYQGAPQKEILRFRLEFIE